VYKIKDNSSLVRFESGDIFGEIDVLLEPLRICDVKCLLYTETFRMDSQEFISVLKSFKEEKIDLYEIADKKLKSIKVLLNLVSFFAEKAM
jgi:CRP-like cAMP-binding protein